MVARKTKAIEIFRDFFREKGEVIGKKEFDFIFYGRELRRGESNWYYAVRKKFLEEVDAQ